MRCYCCNRPLNDFESTLKGTNTGEYLDTCQQCLEGLDIDTLGRPDLNPFDDVPEDFEWDDFEVEPDEDVE